MSLRNIFRTNRIKKSHIADRLSSYFTTCTMQRSDKQGVNNDLHHATNSLSKLVVDSSTSVVRVPPKGKTLAVQYNLPRLPVPPLEQSLNKYLDAVRPLLSDSQFEETKKKVNDFKTSDGPELQTLLEKRAEDHVNWLSEWWKQKGYLEGRDSVTIGVSPGYYLSKQPYRDLKGQLEFAAKAIVGILEFKKILEDQSLPVDTLGGKPLCMLQHYQILNACRIPGPTKDTHVCKLPGEPGQPRHINVMHNNHIFSVDVIDAQGQPLSPGQIHRQLEQCVSQSQTQGPPVGILTTADRDTWYQGYSQLVKDADNKASIDNIIKSIFVLNLDGPYSPGSEDLDTFAAQMSLHGGGSKGYSANRWCDKTLQLSCNQDGYVGLTYEHTTAEGPAIGGLLDFLFDFLKKEEVSLTENSNDNIQPRKLNFKVNDATQELITKSFAMHDAAVNDLMYRVLKFPDYGKNFIKSQNLSPDAYIQVALQLAYYRMYKRPTATYESGSLRRFQYGRTDTIRSCSIPSTAFAQAMDNPSVAISEKVDLLRKAVMTHRKYTDGVVSGQGIDRHFLGLKLIAAEHGKPVPDVLSDAAFKEGCNFRLSTSQIVSKHGCFAAFGGGVKDGYGVCYGPYDNDILFSVTSYRQEPSTDSDKMCAMITRSLLDMRDILVFLIFKANFTQDKADTKPYTVF